MYDNYNDKYKNTEFNERIIDLKDFGYENSFSKDLKFDNKYLLLPEAYDVFTNINFKDIDFANDEQKQFMERCLNYIEFVLKNKHKEIGIVKVLPKLSLSHDEDGAITIHWDYFNYKIFIDIEKDVSQSFYGIVYKKGLNSIAYTTEPLTEDNYINAITSIVDFIFDN